MRKSFVIGLSVLLGASSISISEAANVAGQKCTKLNQRTNTVGGTLICAKSGSKLLWKILPISAPSKAPTPIASPAATSSPAPVASLAPASWKQLTSDEIISQSTQAIDSYLAVKRTLNQEVIVLVQPGIDPLWKDFIAKGASLVAQAFTYPAIGKPFYDVVALDKDWLATAYKGAGFSDREVQDRVGGFATGSPAFGGALTNTWNMSVLSRNNSLATDKAGTYQTPGHEFFHGIQERFAGRNPGPTGEEIPNWFWEGPAMYVGIHSASVAGYIDFKSEGRASMVNRFMNGRPSARAMSLVDVKANDGVSDPYAIGYAATEYLISQVGVERLLNIYAELGKGKSFANAFEAATGLTLSDFYAHFEGVRASLGFAKG